MAITIWWLGTNVEYRTISYLFGVGISTACNIICKVCKAILDSPFHKCIKTPVGNEAKDIVRGFEEKWSFPQCIHAVDGSHIPIIPPAPTPPPVTAPLITTTERDVTPLWCKLWLFTRIDSKMFYVEWPGSVHDARILSNSVVFAKGSQEHLCPIPYRF